MKTKLSEHAIYLKVRNFVPSFFFETLVVIGDAQLLIDETICDLVNVRYDIHASLGQTDQRLQWN